VACANGSEDVAIVIDKHNRARIARNGGSAHLRAPDAGKKHIMYGVNLPDPLGRGRLIKYRSIQVKIDQVVDESVVVASTAAIAFKRDMGL
jgi:hypothetical protein